MTGGAGGTVGEPRGAAQDPLVSVSITTYNHAPYIAQAVESVLAQEAPFPIEIIVGDDCSTDGTREILRTLDARHPGRLRLVLPERNLGRNGIPLFLRTLEPARGRYVAAFDGDDYWTSPHKLARQVAFLEAHPECSMCVHDALEVREGSASPPRRTRVVDEGAPRDTDAILERNAIPSCSPLFRREVVCPLPAWYAELPIGDLPLYLLAAERGHIGYIEDVLGAYRVHEGGMWSGIDTIRRDRLFLDTRDRLSRATDGRFDARLRRIVHGRWQRFALMHTRRGQLPMARYFAWRLAREWPAPAVDRAQVARELLLAHLRRIGRGLGGR